MSEALAELESAVRASGLVAEGSSGVVLVSGGPDSACAAAGIAKLAGPDSVVGLTLNYRLRPDSDRAEETCRQLCERIGIDLVVERPALEQGNLQELAREARYESAERLRAAREADWIATGHTRTDQVETLLYRIAVSPGRRGLLGMPPRRGHLIRPLLGIERERARRLATDADLPFVDDPSNLDPAYARNRIRAEVLPVMRELSPAAERNIAETRAELAEEAELLDRVVAEALAAAGVEEEGGAIPTGAVEAMEPALRRLVLRALAERAAGGAFAVGRGRVEEILRLAASPEGGELDLGRGVRAVCRRGLIAFTAASRDTLEP